SWCDLRHPRRTRAGAGVAVGAGAGAGQAPASARLAGPKPQGISPEIRRVAASVPSPFAEITSMSRPASCAASRIAWRQPPHGARARGRLSAVAVRGTRRGGPAGQWGGGGARLAAAAARGADRGAGKRAVRPELAAGARAAGDPLQPERLGGGGERGDLGA